MSIGFLKRFLSLSKLAAILVIVGAAWGYYDHRQSMQSRWTHPDFKPEVKVASVQIARIDAVQMPLGRYQRPTQARPEEKVEEKKEELESVLARLGEIKSAVVTYPPYRVFPTIIFEYKQAPAGQEKIRTLRLGEALVDRPHAGSRLTRIPVRYQFIGCEPDPEHPGWTYFLFDMKCDGTDIQKMRWKLEGEERADLTAAAGAADERGVRTVATNDIYIGRGLDAEERRQPEETRPVDAPAPPPEVVPVPVQEPDSIFDEEDGALAPTREGVEYLKKNYQEILKETRTTTYRDRAGRPAGIRITSIQQSSLANQFGIQRDDVILSINGQTVTKQAEAVNVVKAELRKNVRYVTVRLLRRGREIEKRFDTRDPDTRRMARDLR